MLRVAVLSVHTCPLAPLGGWETGGMNVYVRELCRGLSRLGVATGGLGALLPLAVAPVVRGGTVAMEGVASAR